jgi:hypothetical protein
LTLQLGSILSLGLLLGLRLLLQGLLGVRLLLLGAVTGAAGVEDCCWG